MASNVIQFPEKAGRPASSDEKKVQGAERFKKIISSGLRDQLRNECRSKHGFTEPKK